MLDAYTVRKAVPRILLAAIGINISIYLCVALVDITTILGKGIGDLLITGFQADQGVQLVDGVSTESTGGNLVLGGAVLAIVAKLLFSAVTLGPAIIGAFGSILFVVALIALAVLFTLLIRQALVVFLTVVSPVAIACFVLPGTEKYFKKWLDLFVKTLMVYPIIATMFAMSTVMGTIFLRDAANSTGYEPMNGLAVMQGLTQFGQGVANGGDTEQAIKLIAAIVVIYAPLVLIPFAFKLAGGAISAVFNAAQGATDRKRRGLAESRSKRMGEAKAIRRQKMDAGSLFQDRGVGKLVNSYGRRRAAGARNRYGFGERGRAALALNQDAQINETLKNNAALWSLRNNDDANNLLALSGGSESGAVEAARDLFGDPNSDRAQAAIAAARAVGFTRQNAVAAMTTSAQNKWRAVDAGRSDIVQQGIMRLSPNNASEQQSLSYSNAYHSREAGRADLGGHAPDITPQMVQEYSARHGVDQDTAHRELLTLDGMGRTQASAMAGGHNSQIRHQAQVAKRILTSAGSTDQERVQGAMRLLELQKNLQGTSGGGQEVIEQELETLGIDFRATDGIEDQLAKMVNSHAGAPAGTILADGADLSRRARVWDSEKRGSVPLGARGGGWGRPSGGGSSGNTPGSGGPKGGYTGSGPS